MKPLSTSSLNVLRTFTVIGRRLHLGEAAKELHLSPSALSHQLRILEDELGVALFKRTGRGLQLTPAGAILHIEVCTCFSRLDQTIDSIRKKPQTERLVVSGFPTFTMRWLLPRFGSFQPRFPNIEIRVSTQPIDFERDDVDWAIMYGDGSWPGTVAEFLYQETLVVVCNPALLTHSPISGPSDLGHHRLLSASQRERDWDTWFVSCQAQKPQNPDILELESRNLVIQAAEAGLGVALLDPVMIATQLASKTLIQCLPHAGIGSGAYYLVRRQEVSFTPKLEGFRDWLLGELSLSREATP